MSGVLLAIDGDSLAHRAYHAIPKSIRGNGRPANALVGFAGFLTRLWDAEQPESVLVGWDSLETPTYRHEALPAYQSGREFEDAILEQLGVLPALTESLGFAIGKAPGYEADDFLAASAAAWPGAVTVVTSDRDAFQLVSDRVSILQPVKGVSELARIGPAEVRTRYGVDPTQVPDFIALRGDPSDKIPGARGIGAKTAAELLLRYGTLDSIIEAADELSPRQAEAVRDERLALFRHIARMDRNAPVTRPADNTVDVERATAYASEIGDERLAERLRSSPGG
jgi:DNA polymerase-1